MTTHHNEDRYHTLPKAAAVNLVAASQKDQGLLGRPSLQQHHQQQQHSASARRLRESSPGWKEHYAKVSSKWGSFASGSTLTYTQSNVLWEDVRRQKEKGGYPWTHLSHDQDAEVWIDPLSLPSDISTATMRRKDKSIPREWFHLPQGAQAPTVDELMRDSSPETDSMIEKLGGQAYLDTRAKSPPICGRSRSKSRERMPKKYSSSNTTSQESNSRVFLSSDGGYEPVGQQSKQQKEAPSKPQRLNVPTDREEPMIKKTRVTSSQSVPPPLTKQISASATSDEENSEAATSCFKVRSRSRSKSKDRNKASREQNGSRQGRDPTTKSSRRSPPRKTEQQQVNGDHLPPYAKVNKDKDKSDLKAKKESTTLPEVDTTKLKTNQDQKRPTLKRTDTDDGYEPVGKDRRNNTNPFLTDDSGADSDNKLGGTSSKVGSKIYEDIPDVLPLGDKSDTEAKKGKTDEQLRKEDKVKSRKEKGEQEGKKFQNDQQEREGQQKLTGKEQKELDEKERKLKERELRAQKEKEEKELKKQREKEEEVKRQKEKIVKEKKEKEEKEKKLKEKELKEQKAREEKELKEKKSREEKEIKEKKAREEKERKLREKEVKEQKEKEKEKKLREKEQKEKEEKERKIREKELKEQKEKEEKERKLKEKEEKKGKNKDPKKEEDKGLVQIQDKKSTENEEIKDEENVSEALSLEQETTTAQLTNGLTTEETADQTPDHVVLDSKPVVEDQQVGHTKYDGKNKKGNALEEKARKEREAMEKKHKEKVEKEMKEQAEKEKKAEKERKEREAKEKKQREKLEKEQKERDEKERKQKAKEEKLRKEQEEKEKKLKAKQEKGKTEDEIENLPPDSSEVQLEPDSTQLLPSTSTKSLEESSKKNKEEENKRQKEEDKKKKELLKQEEKERKLQEKEHKRLAKEAKVAEEKLKKQKLKEDKERKALEKEEQKFKEPKDQKRHLFHLGTKTKPQSNSENEQSPFEEMEFSQQQAHETEATSGLPTMEGLYEPIAETKPPPTTHSLDLVQEPVFLTQPVDELDSRAITMASQQQKQPQGGSNSPDAFDQFQQGYGQPGPNGQYYEDEEDFDIDIDYAPQNGYEEEDNNMPGLSSYEHQTADTPTTSGSNKKQKVKSMKERPSREPMKMPQVDIKGKFKSMNDKVKGARMPSPHELRDSYLNSAFHKQFKQPLAVRSRIEDVDVAKARQLTVQKNTPSKLGNLNHPLDIPLPKLKSSSKGESAAKEEAQQKEKDVVEAEEPKDAGSRLYQTLPRSWRQQNLITSTREITDPEELAVRQHLVQTKSPAELSKFSSFSDIPVPTKIKNIMSPSERKITTQKKRRHSVEGKEEPAEVQPKEPFSLYGTLPRSMRETKLVTNTRDITDEEDLRRRRELVQSKSPAELSQIHGLGDMPVPTKIQNMFKSRSRSNSIVKIKRSRSESLPRNLAGTMYATLPKSWKEQKLITQVKVEQDPEVLAKRKTLTETKTPAQLAQISSVADLPIPTALENFLKSEKKPKGKVVSEGSGRMNLEDMYNNLPRSLKQELLVKSVTGEEDEEVLRERRALVQAKKPGELSQMQGLGDFPLPTAVENIFKTTERKPKPPTRRKSQDDAKRKRNLTTGGILSYDNLPDSLKTEVLVRTKVEEDPEVVRERQELCRSKTPNQLSQIGGLSDFPLPQKVETLLRPGKRTLKSTKDKEQLVKEKRSKSWSSLTNREAMYNSLPSSMKTECLVRARVEDPDLQRQRAETVKTKTVSQLAQIESLSDFPVPKTIENLLNAEKRAAKKQPQEKDPNEEEKPLKDKLYATLPKSMKSEVLVRVRDEDPEIQRQRQELTRSKSPVELSQMSSLSDFPIPTNIENLLHKKSETGPAVPTPPPRRFKKEDMYESLPASLKTEVLVRSKFEGDEEVLKHRQELTRSKSPAQLSEIHGLNEFPIPTFVENLTKKKTVSEPDHQHPQGEKEVGLKGMYEKLPGSLKTEVLVRAKVEDPEVQRERAEAVKSKSVGELSQINSMNEFPLPRPIEQLVGRAPRPVERRKRFREKQRSMSAKNIHEKLMAGVPESMKTQVLVKSCVEDPEVQRERKQVVDTKSVSELSQISNLSEFPIPTSIERLISRSKSDLAGVNEGGPPTINWTSMSNMYSTLPSSLKTEVLVRSRVESPEVQQQRREITQSKSVSELSQVHSLADFPIPANIEKLIQARKQGKTEGEQQQPPRVIRPLSPAQLQENIYATLPRSLKSEVLVRTRVESPDVIQVRRELVQSKSVSELSQVRSLADLPIPKTIENLMQKKIMKPKSEAASTEEPTSTTDGMSSKGGGHYDIYASLPRSLKKEVLVRSKVEENEEVLKKRQALVESKSPGELSQIHSFSEVPLPSRIEAWLHHSEQETGSGKTEQRTSRSFHELRSKGIYETLPKALKEPTLVRSKVEDPEVQRERYELTRTRTPSQLAEMNTVSDIPIPGLWERGRERSSKQGSGSGRSSSLPRNKHEIKEIVYNKILPESLTKPCVVRCKTEDPNVLKERQQVQQNKSIHELSKIRNVNEFPLPLKNVRLPDIPLPKAKDFLKLIARTPNKNGRGPTKTNQHLDTDEGYTPASTPLHSAQDRTYTDDEMLRYDMSSPDDSTAHREQDFGYEVIEGTDSHQQDVNKQFLGHIPAQFREDIQDAAALHQDHAEEEESSISVADHYKGTPPLRSKKKKHRYSHEVPEQVQLGDELPPPLPPKNSKGGPPNDPTKRRPDEGFDMATQSSRVLQDKRYY